ncbi:MAG: glycosyltransferase family 4 protein [Solirubrobacteraceae bacterium]
MPARPGKVLVICHVSAAELAATAVQSLYGAGHSPGARNAPDPSEPLVDMLCYGRASEDRPAPVGFRFVGPPVRETVARATALRMLIELRARRYRLVALSQPALGLSRVRGPLVACAYFLSRGRSVILDPAAGREIRPIRARLAAVELSRWLVLNLFSRLLAPGALALVRHLSGGAPGGRPLSSSGSVVYLRTDIDLSTAPLKAGGSVAHTQGIVQALLDRGYDVAYWGTGDVDGIPDEMPRRRLPVLLKGNLATEISELLSGLVQGWELGGSSAPAARNASAFVYQRYSLNNLAGVILSRRWRIPLVLEANGSEAKWRQDFGTLKYSKLAYACERLILGRAAIVSAVSQNAAEDLMAAGGPPERIRVVPNGVAVQRFAGARPMPLPAELNGCFVVCFVGLFYPWHGVRFLAEAFGLLHERHSDARLLLVGDGEELPVVKAVLERHQALGATHFTGLVARADAPRYMAAADVLVSPHADIHRFIGSPIKLFEYMAAGKPIVATTVGQIPEMLTDEKTALLVAPEDPQAMASAFERLREDVDLRQRLGGAAQAEARTTHSWDARLRLILDGIPGLAKKDPA